MSDSVDSSMSCPICLETMSSPILQCDKGHSVCGNCVQSNAIKQCPLCRSVMTKTRNYQLEDLIIKLKDVTLLVACNNASRGCKYELRVHEKDSHQAECKSRVYKCEGKLFNQWNCDWTGSYVDILQHFKHAHRQQCWMQFSTEFCMKINLKSNFSDIQIIDFQNGQQLFWYKHKTDVKRKKAFWLFQYVGLKKQASQYYYEFEIHDGGARKIKITELCESDCKDANLIFRSEKCVALPFSTLKNFFNEKEEVSIRFRIMKLKKEFVNNSAPAVTHHSSTYAPVRVRNR